MERVSHFRARAFTAIFALVLCFFAYKLYDLQIVETEGKVNNVTAYTTWTRVKAARGDILDRNGNVLVGNRASYDLVINHYVMRSSPTPNQSIYDLVTLCKDLGIEYTDRFPVTQSRPFTYTLDNYNSAWQGYFQTFLQNRGQLDPDISAPC
jgi:penicillin-binding protein 2